MTDAYKKDEKTELNKKLMEISTIEKSYTLISAQRLRKLEFIEKNLSSIIKLAILTDELTGRISIKK